MKFFVFRGHDHGKQNSGHFSFLTYLLLCFHLTVGVLSSFAVAHNDDSNRTRRPRARSTRRVSHDSSSLQSTAPALSFDATDQTIRIPLTAISPSLEPADYRDKTYLIHSAITPQSGVPTSENTLSRIVYFFRQGNSVILMEDLAGQVVTPDLPAANILARLPIIKADNESVSVDFNTGMRRIYTASGWHTSDVDGTEVNSESHYTGLTASQSVLRSAEQSGDTLTLRQILQTNTPMEWGTRAFPSIQVTYYISPYKTNPRFQVRENDNTSLYAFFESPPHFEVGTGSGRSITPITRWSLPPEGEFITYYISANTPEQYRPAIREGVLYWNKAFGREVFKVEIAPEGITAPHPNYNIIQWVKWDNAPISYADVNSDPRTGEIHNAQIYLTSAFGLNNDIIRHILRNVDSKNSTGGLPTTASRMDDGKSPLDPRIEEMLTPASLRSLHSAPQKRSFRDIIFDRFPSSRKCQFNATATLQPLLGRLLDLDLTEEELVEISAPFLTHTVAHEVGHTVGERHNFAGNQDANLGIYDAQAIFERALSRSRGGRLRQGERVSSTVMDYPSFQDRMLTGASLPFLKMALPYDAYSISRGYDLEDTTRTILPRDARRRIPFCSDSAMDQYLDCEIGVSGNRPLLDYSRHIRTLLETLPNAVLEPYILALTAKHPQDRYDVSEIVLTPSTKAIALAENFAKSLFWFDRRAQSLHAEILHDTGEELQIETRRQATLDFTNSQIAEAGSVEQAFFWFLPLAEFDEQPTGQNRDIHGLMNFPFEAQLEVILARFQTNGFRGEDGAIRKLTTAEAQEIRTKGRMYFASFRKLVLSYTLRILENSNTDLEFSIHGRIVDNSPTAELQDLIGRFAAIVIGTTDPSPAATVQGIVDIDPRTSPRFSVQKPLYSQALRRRAARVFAAQMGSSPSWSMDGRRNVAEGLIERISSNLAGLGINTIADNLYAMEQPLRDWVMDELEIVEILASAPGCEDLLDNDEDKKRQESRPETPAGRQTSRFRGRGTRYPTLFRRR